jgi:hypothetical protein
MKTIGDYILLMKHALGKTPATGHDLYSTLNEAGRQLFTMHEWSWCHQGPYTLATVSGRDYIELPDDFGTVLHLYQPTTTVNAVQIVTLQELALLRQSTVGVGSFAYSVAFTSSVPAANAGVAPTKRALIYPEPSANGTPAILMLYRRAWVDVTEANENDYPSIDRDAEGLLSMLAQDRAYLMENKRPLFEPGVIDAEFARVRMADGSKQWMVGPLRGGAGDRIYGIPRYPMNTVTMA